ncbi:hypothetical protein WR25_07143 [Diploscapter pachys]|uniref:Major facilitator superfamily (MFS) profile domain-containing protein n=1 Tax=Diploscapter pachys TaxID=2018661 RepID=A0A2A2JF84_9BILA|nr:hypothetical protein WR25_07143 [Diploscapter pachys]
MLASSFYEPSIEYCSSRNANLTVEGEELYEKWEFNSLLVRWDLHCQKSKVLMALPSATMFGALFGSLVSGWAADKYGRRITIICCLAIVLLGNLTILSGLSESWKALIFVSFCIGAPCGGYMVCNLTLIIEALELSSSRLIVVSLNGWSISMHLLTVESSRWLASVNRLAEARKSAIWIAKKNNICTINDSTESEWYEIVHLSPPIKPASSNEPIGNFEVDENRNLSERSGQFSSIQKRYGYSELCRHSRISIPLIGLCYCFIAASIISFGFYFYLDFLPGNRYLNMGLMGMFKFLFELFPTAVRSMARGVCSVGARLGSAVAPLITQLRFVNTVIPYVIFAILLSIQTSVAFFALPETKNRPLPAELPEKFKRPKNSGNQQRIDE